jgi:hypothetical protein
MKISTNTKSTVATQGVQSSSGFSIATTAHMFGILSDGLYSDKIGAVLREIGANAMDAHIMAGKHDQPFEVKLPSQFDKTFHIKDFGPGLSDQDVRELYTTYGWSSKQNSNETTGAFGLGSKSPFAYTDAFSICAVKDGVKRIYTAHKDDTGKPVVSLMSETASDDSWKAGVMVTFAVQPDDIDEFVHKAGKIFRWFKVKPTVIGAKLELKEPKFKTRGPNFGLFSALDDDRHPRVIMANVAYPLNVSRLEGVSELGKAVASCGAHLFVPTGTVMPTPNREDLQYDKASRPVLVAALQEVAQAVAQEIYDRVKAEECSTWEWRKRIREYANSLPDTLKFKIKDLLALVCPDPVEAKKLENLFSENYCDVPKWVGDSRDAPYRRYQRDAKGAILRDAAGNELYEKMDIRGCRVWAYSLHDRSKTRGTNPVKRREVVRGQMRDGSNGEYKDHKVSYTDEVIVMVADVGRADLRVKYMMDLADKTNLKVLLVQPTRGADKAFVQAYAEKLAGDTANGLGGVPVQKVSDIELPMAVIERAKSTRLTMDDRRELFLEEERRYVSLTDPDNPVQQVSVGDYEDDSDKYFILAKMSGNTVRFVSHANDGVQVNLEIGKVESLAQAVANLRALAPLKGMTGFFILDPSEVTRLKLMEAGWKPAMRPLTTMLKDPVWTKELAKVVDTTPVIAVSDEWNATQAGFVGLLAYHFVKGFDFGKKVQTLMPDHTLVLVAQRLVANYQASLDGKFVVPDNQDVNKLISKVNEYLPHHDRIAVAGMARMSASEVLNKSAAAYPALRLLELANFKETAKKDPQMAANLFWQFASLQVKNADSKEATALQQLAA